MQGSGQGKYLQQARMRTSFRIVNQAVGGSKRKEGEIRKQAHKNAKQGELLRFLELYLLS